MSDQIPTFCYFMLPVLDRTLRPFVSPRLIAAGVGVALLAIVSVLPNYWAVTSWAVPQWSAQPVSIDDAPWRVWDITDVQFLRALR